MNFPGHSHEAQSTSSTPHTHFRSDDISDHRVDTKIGVPHAHHVVAEGLRCESKQGQEARRRATEYAADHVLHPRAITRGGIEVSAQARHHRHHLLLLLLLLFLFWLLIMDFERLYSRLLHRAMHRRCRTHAHEVYRAEVDDCTAGGPLTSPRCHQWRRGCPCAGRCTRCELASGRCSSHSSTGRMYPFC